MNYYKIKSPNSLYGIDMVLDSKQLDCLPEDHKQLFQRITAQEASRIKNPAGNRTHAAEMDHLRKMMFDVIDSGIKKERRRPKDIPKAVKVTPISPFDPDLF